MITKKEYKNSRSKLVVKCNVCKNIWHPSLNTILCGKWCKVCAINKSKKYTHAFVKNFIEEKGGKLLSQYVNSSTKLDILCNDCGTIWHPSFCSIYNIKTWCPNCKYKNQKLLVEIVKKLLYSGIIKTEYSPEYLKTKYGGRQRIDILAIIGKQRVGIEYDGRQHFMPVPFNKITEKQASKNFKKIKELDKFKNKKIKEHPEDINIFIRIPYTEDITEKNILKILIENGIKVPKREK